MANVLLFIIVKLSVYGLIAGLLCQKFNLWISLVVAIVLGRVVVLSAIFLFSNINAVNFVLSALRDGWQGIALQIVLVPVIVKKLSQYFRSDEL